MIIRITSYNVCYTKLLRMIRSNPGLVLIQDGNIIGKWHYNDMPKALDMKNPASFSISELKNKNEISIVLICFLILSILSIMTIFKNK